jgi:hypothetical protein
MKNAVFRDVAPRSSCVNRRFGVTYRLQPPAHAGSSLADFSTLKIGAIHFSETSVHTRTTRRHSPENGVLQNIPSLERDLTTGPPEHEADAPYLIFILFSYKSFTPTSELDKTTSRLSVHRVTCSNHNVIDSCPGGTRFESRPGQWLS